MAFGVKGYGFQDLGLEYGVSGLEFRIRDLGIDGFINLGFVDLEFR